MNRQIKFRAWDKESKRMSVLRLWDFAHGEVEMGKETQPIADRFEHEVEIMQFTGLLDKDGKEIYEGDILFYTNDSSRQRRKPFVVVWGNYVNCMGFNITDRGRKNGVERTGKYEIIGNIYENKDLLK